MLAKIIAAFLLLITLPFLVFIALLIYSFERDTILFTQQRLGKDKKYFTLYKIRTMQQNKITSLGNLLRKTGIDEIPQLYNIIIGDINFIGPRPLAQVDVDRLGWNTNYYKKRWTVKPGLTGLAQLSPICHKKMTYFWDNYYVNNKSSFLKLKIIVASGLSLIIGKNKVKKIIKYKLKK